MSFFKTRREYFEHIATKNKLIAHDADTVNGKKRKSFFRMNNEQELMTGVANLIHFPCVVLYDFTGAFSEDKNAIAKSRITNQLLFLSKKGSSADLIEQAQDEAFLAMCQFISYIYNDYNINGRCSNFYDIDLSRFNWVSINPIGPYLYGWELIFEDEQAASKLISFNAENWI